MRSDRSNGSLSPMAAETAEPGYWTPWRKWTLAYVLFAYVVFFMFLAIEAAALGSIGAFGSIFPGVSGGVGAGIAFALSGKGPSISQRGRYGLALLVSFGIGTFVALKADASWPTALMAAALVAVCSAGLNTAAWPLFRRACPQKRAQKQTTRECARLSP